MRPQRVPTEQGDPQSAADPVHALQPPGGDRHPPLVQGDLGKGVTQQHCARLHRMVLGRAAAELLAAPVVPGRLITLASWWWTTPRTAIGRKGRPDREGRGAHVPIRIVHESGPVLVLQAGRSGTTWVAAGMGHAATGRLVIDVPADKSPPALVDGVDWMLCSSSPDLADGAVITELERLVADGEAARWEMVTALRTPLAGALRIANASLAADLSAFHGEQWHGVVDSTRLQEIGDWMLLGNPDHDLQQFHRSSVMRLVDNCTNPSTFAGVDPLRHLRISLRRDSQQALSAAIGDPRIGRKIRQVSLDIGSRDPQAVVEAYRLRHPGDRLDLGRALRAMGTYPDETANRVGGDLSEMEWLL